jgi:hypothetical protein
MPVRLHTSETYWRRTRLDDDEEPDEADRFRELLAEPCRVRACLLRSLFLVNRLSHTEHA